jgi:hypothetical protein
MIMRFAFLAALALFAAGCGTAEKLAPVSGKVTLDGKPLAGAHVAFQPLATKGNDSPGGGSFGVTDTSGSFTLVTFEGDQPGAVVGKHRVEINAMATSSDTDPRLRAAQPKVVVPMKYNRKSELTFEVPPGGTTEANFDLKSQ